MKGPRVDPKSDVDLPLPKVLRVLCVEDVPEDAELYLRVLQKAGYQVTADVVNTREEFAHKLESGSYDVVLSDYRMPGWSGAEALEILKRSAKDIPFLLVTGTIGEEAAAEFIKQGAADYILKDRAARLPVAVYRALEEKAARNVRARIEEALHQAEEKYRRIFEQAVVGIFQTTPDGRILSANPAMARLFGYDSPAELMAGITDIAHEVYVDPGERELLKRQLEKNGRVHDLEYQGYRKDGSKIWLLENAYAVHDSSGATLYYEGTVVDITDRKATEERVRYLAYYDPLTGLPNRILLRDRLTKALATARRHKGKVAILFLDLDRFKDINDTFGHSSGDLLLQDVAERLKRCVREQDTVARLSGDEFLIALTDIKDNSDVAVFVKRFMDAMTAEFIVRGQSLGITFSLGISMFPEHGADGQTLIKNADAAMYCAKNSGRANVQFFTNASERCQTESSGLS